MLKNILLLTFLIITINAASQNSVTNDSDKHAPIDTIWEEKLKTLTGGWKISALLKL
ncbi:MAG: hypothetical protein IPN13_10945 [Bacteroidetes bacterium]|nr:hypothetical protein [Bacteroidota bacterium]MBK8874399.1 hypothetical protein [Bacteroidota bacterium]